jgi:hypothetical protein
MCPHVESCKTLRPHIGDPGDAILAFSEKQLLKDAKMGTTARTTPPHTLGGVGRGDQQYEQLIVSNRENLLTIQTLESNMERLKSDLEGEVSNNEKLNNALSVSIALVDNLNT